MMIGKAVRSSSAIRSAVVLLDEGHAESEGEIREWMSGNTCRCSAYPNILAASARRHVVASSPIVFSVRCSWADRLALHAFWFVFSERPIGRQSLPQLLDLGNGFPDLRLC